MIEDRSEKKEVRMRGSFSFSVLMAVFVLILSSCRRNDDTLVGRWTVEKVNVEFREDLATPEMVRQYGMLEQDNVIEISRDSVLTLVSGGDTLRGKCSLQGGSLYCDGSLFGQVKDGVLITETPSPIGTVKVVYKNNNPSR